MRIFPKTCKNVSWKNSSWKTSDVVKHFELEGNSRRTVYSVLNKLETTQTVDEEKRTGRPTSWVSGSQGKLKRLVNNKTGVSQRRLGQRFGVCHSTVGRQLSKIGVKYKIREKIHRVHREAAQKGTKGKPQPA